MSLVFQNATQEENTVKTITYNDFDKLLKYMDNCEIETTEEIDTINNVLNILGLTRAFYDYVKYKNDNKKE